MKLTHATSILGLLVTGGLAHGDLPADAEAPDPNAPVYHLEEFTVVSTGTRTERLLVDVPIKTDVLGRSDFDSALTYDLGQALELLNGARTEDNCQNCGAPEVQLLGLPGNYNRILVDGLPLFTGTAAIYGIDQVPTILLDRIEVVKGGGSALYGPGAVAGVINLIPEEPFSTHGHADFTYRSIDGEPAYQSQFAGFYVNEDKSFKAALYGLYSDRDAYDANGDGFTEIGERENSTLGTYLWWTPSDRTRLRFNYQYMGEERRGGDRLDRPVQFSQVAEATDTDYQWTSVRWDQEISNSLRMSLSAAMVNFERDSYYGGTGSEIVDPSDPLVDAAAKTYNSTAPDSTAPQGSDAAIAAALFGDPPDGTGGGSFNNFGVTESDSYFFDAKFEYDLGQIANTGSHRFVFGFSYEEENLDDDQLDVNGVFIDKLHDDVYDNFGIYFQDEWQVNEQLEFVPGIRADKTNTLEDWIFSPRIAARYLASSELTLRGNFSTGFLAPRVFDEDLHIESMAGVPTDIVNPDDLEEERSFTLALGADYTPDALDGRLVTSLQSYYTILEDSFRVEEATGTAGPNGREEIERFNTEGSTIFGLELDLAYRFDEHWTANAGLAYSQSRYDEEQEIFSGVFSDRYNKVPDWSGLFQLVYDNDDFFDAYFAVKWTGEMDVARESTATVENSSDFFVVDLGVSKTFALNDSIDLTLRAGIENLLDDYQDDYETGVDRDPGYIYGPRYPRTFIVGARIDF
ncbi:MAG: TonB-dependent receptor plug domain-containing protein [Opitutales bacterium]